MTDTLLRGRLVDAYAIGTTAMFYAFISGGSGIVASLYSAAGLWIEDRASIASAFPDPGLAVMIASDSNGSVGDASLAWRSADDEISVWDVEGAALYTYTAAVGESVSAPVYRSGYLYWWELEGVPGGTWYFRRALCDLTSSETVASEVAVVGPPSPTSWGAPGGVAASAAACIGSATWQDVETTHAYAMRATWAGAISLPADWESVSSVEGIGWAASGGVSLLIGSGGALESRSDGIDDATVPRWPTTGQWELGTGINAHVAANGAMALAYGLDPINFIDRTAVVAPSTATGGNPALRVTLAAHPTTGSPPDLLFLLE